MATYIHNILPSKANNYVSPTQSLYLRIPSYSTLCVFGCLCYPHLPSASINKLDPRSTPCVFLGFPSNHRGYLCLELVTRKLIVSRHVTFHETIFPFHKLHTPSPSAYTFLDLDPSPYLKHYLHHTPPATTPPLHVYKRRSRPPPPSPPATSPQTPDNPPSPEKSPTTTSPTSSSITTPLSTPPLLPSLPSPQITTRLQHDFTKPVASSTFAPLPPSLLLSQKIPSLPSATQTGTRL